MNAPIIITMKTSVETLLVLAGAMPCEAWPIVRKEIAARTIVTNYDPKPIPTRSFDWSALDRDSYDGADDSSTRNQIGYGATEAEAIADLKMILEDA